MDKKEIFIKQLKIEPKVMSIEILFNNSDRVENTIYDPPYQRNYVWDDEKATYFIESILLGTEIPPLVYFRNGEKVEVIDGRQRYQTILRFIRNEFKLRKNGLQKLADRGIANKFFNNMDSSIQDLFWDTKLRIIEFSFHSQDSIDDEREDYVKKEIFYRYNSGITPLKPSEIDKAIYFENDLNSHIRNKLEKDQILFNEISRILHIEKKDIDAILKQIRQLLVQHQIPIKYYASQKKTVISRFYDLLSNNLEEQNIDEIYNKFIGKINLLSKIKKSFPEGYNRLISECLFWAFSIVEETDYTIFEKIKNQTFIDNLVKYLYNNLHSFRMLRSTFSKELFERYQITADFFTQELEINFDIYLYNNSIFKEKNKVPNRPIDQNLGFDDLRINKPEPSSTAIVDICRQMDRQRFLIRPPYQRNEVVNKKKSSAIIESILLGIKLPPIFVYKREDGISEVLDGQQRLLSILGFIGKPYLDENGHVSYSNKNNFSLNLKNAILEDLSGKKFDQLPKIYQDKILNFDLWLIEINHKNNSNFEPIDLFVRLNNKPYPIKEDTFEMWNSYISRDIIDAVKSIYGNNKSWFFLRKNNSRMENENMYTTLVYFQYNWIRQGNTTKNYIPNEIDIYKVGNRIAFRVKSKSEITKVLEKAENKDLLIQACQDLEFNFIRKIKNLLSKEGDETEQVLNKNLDDLFHVENGRRTQQSFYALWYFLFDISERSIKDNRHIIREKIKNLFKDISDIEDKAVFDDHVTVVKKEFALETVSDIGLFLKADLGDISNISNGRSHDMEFHGNSQKRYFFNEGSIPCLDMDKLQIQNLIFTPESVKTCSTKHVKYYYEWTDKILINKLLSIRKRLQVVLHQDFLASNNDKFLCLKVVRKDIFQKYILCILFSTYTYNKLLSSKDSPVPSTISLLNISELKKLKIPIIATSEQKIFENIINYYICCQPKSEQSLYFERVIDALVYELYFPSEFNQTSINIRDFIRKLPILDMKLDEKEKKTIVMNVYRTISAPSHDLSLSLLKLVNMEINFN